MRKVSEQQAREATVGQGCEKLQELPIGMFGLSRVRVPYSMNKYHRDPQLCVYRTCFLRTTTPGS